MYLIIQRIDSIKTPAETLQKTARYLEKWGEGAIIGITGPGALLANPETNILPSVNNAGQMQREYREGGCTCRIIPVEEHF
jgi:hypothetical protein